MKDDFDAEALRPVFYGDEDPEVTVGPAVMVGLALGLLTICGLCFWLGYWMGGRGVHVAPAAVLPAAAPAAAPAAGSTAKPAAAAKKTLQRQDVVSLPASGVAGANAGANSQYPGSASASSANAASPVVKPALPGAVGTPTLALMVQIAAVSQQEDADVLVGALRRRGYAVAVRRNPADGQLHVQVGPFTNRSDADTMREKLINDGYNAIVEP